ncbi:alpha-1,3-mannosyl-glycoprotein 4-beta-N-acetylglucosaminyltransferase C isoform X3 [Esox lucius]|uniref:alpha-1,3-mannosyl-glycoprotein 4-beta-N-acetylglucosaminyltransferase C isoform X3 n=1 Tax=Esox lucius TaxID=8010 RepID=UPI0010BDA36B|nr:alpha-1,3-mannosyl-glycoprotein 4-beta-N-acetylglucosaminyltransferase C isoform X3 [Esox lucius]XP_034152051.1 alpha-1,3-mannosyl-glycoprotein 4-beta-N-acetylglucosaminyltransferase C isoform X3 [Esox lucius]
MLFILLFCGTFLIVSFLLQHKRTNNKWDLEEATEEMDEWHWPVSSVSWVDQGQYLPLNVSYKLLAGTPPTEQKYLTIGLCSVSRPKDGYLISTLSSVFSHSSATELSAMLVVVLLADFDFKWRKSTVKEIRANFPSQLEQGQLIVVHVPKHFYPPLTGLKRNFNDQPARVTFRSKQNVDYSFLLQYCAGLSLLYLQLEDDVSCSKNFLSAIRGRVQQQEKAGRRSWVTLEFSALGYIGKLYHSEHLPLLARFLFLFYQEMPCDFLFSHFRVLLTQGEAIRFTPSLFQHIGTFSSFQGSFNKLKDVDFEEDLYSNPLADVYTDITVYNDQVAALAWSPGTKTFFWGQSPSAGNHLTVVFKEPVVVTSITVETGSAEGRDRLGSATVELGVQAIEEGTGRTCKEFYIIGSLDGGKMKMTDINKKSVGIATSCLRIRVTASQQEWVIIRKIRITTKEE